MHWTLSLWRHRISICEISLLHHRLHTAPVARLLPVDKTRHVIAQALLWRRPATRHWQSACCCLRSSEHSRLQTQHWYDLLVRQRCRSSLHNRRCIPVGSKKTELLLRRKADSQLRKKKKTLENHQMSLVASVSHYFCKKPHQKQLRIC